MMISTMTCRGKGNQRVRGRRRADPRPISNPEPRKKIHVVDRGQGDSLEAEWERSLKCADILGLIIAPPS